MDQILSEKDLMPSGISWGDWNVSLTDAEVEDKIKSLSQNNEHFTSDCNSQWLTLFSLLPKIPKKDDVIATTADNLSVKCLDDSMSIHSPMECSPVHDSDQEQIRESDTSISSMEDVVICLVDTCNQAASKLKTGLSAIREDMSSVVSEVQKLNLNMTDLVMEKAWSQLSFEGAKVCFCVCFSSTPDLCKLLCKNILIPWISVTLPTKLVQFSELFSLESEIFCLHLIAPLLLLENSPLVKDLFSLEEIMNSMEKRHWTLLLTETISNIVELHTWNIPLLAMIIEQSEPTPDNVCGVVQLMSATGTSFSQSRDYGALLVAIAQCLKPGFGSVVTQLKLIANGYKGPLKFKALKLLNDIKEL